MLQPELCRSECPVLLPDAMVMSWAELQLKPMSGCVTLLQQGSVLMSKVPVAIEDYVDVQNLAPYWCLRATPPLGMC